MNTKLELANITNEYRAIYNVEILSSGIYLPEDVITSDDLMCEIRSEKLYNIPITDMSNKIGIKERRVAKIFERPSTLAINAARQALAASYAVHVEKLVFCGISKDQEEPATAHVINNELGLKAKDVYDVTDACFGFIRGLQDCIRSIQLGEIESALIVTGETPSRGISDFIKQLKTGVNVKTAKKIIGFLTAGDAGGAILLGRATANSGSRFGRFWTKSDSRLWDKCHYQIDQNGKHTGQMLMGQLTARGRRIGQALVNEIKLDQNWKEPDHILSHNTGHGSFELLLNFGLAPRHKWFKTYEDLGNLMSATFPVNYHLQNQAGVFQKGQSIGCIFNGSGLIFGYFTYYP